MDEVTKMVADKAHISQDQARVAVQTVLDFLKQKMPPQMAGQVDALMSGSAPNLGDVSKGLGGILGG